MFIALVIFALLLCVGLLIPAVLLVHGTVTKNKLGVNPNPSQCPRCHTALPSVRVPKSFKQAMWGGGTCPNCGCEVDKWGREI